MNFFTWLGGNNTMRRRSRSRKEPQGRINP
jgi:hypothetical protein